MERERLGSRIGFILLSAGCAVGIGNVWKFPYITGQYGGAIFVLFYLVFLVILGIPVMTMEFSVGRAAQKSPVHMYQQLEKKGTKWHLHGFAAFLGNFVLMMCYTTIAGWMLQYFFNTARGAYVGMDAAQVGESFGNMLADPVSMTIFMAVVVIAGFAINSIGLQKGLERITKYMMGALIVLILVLAINSIFLKGSGEGLKFYLLPNVHKMKDAGILNVIVAAMNQAFFTLSLGMGSMAIFGSYLGKDRSLMGESVHVAALDTFVAICSGLIIFPACSAYGVQVNSGPRLIFITLPNIFNHLPLGRLWGSFFFLFMFFAAFSTVLAVFEVLIACTCDLTGWNRKKACFVGCIAVLIASLPCVLGFNVLSGFQPLKAGNTIMDLEDFFVSNILLPLGSLVFVLFCTRKMGWGWEKFTKEANTGTGIQVKPWMRWYCTYVLPVIIMGLFIIGMIQYFA